MIWAIIIGCAVYYADRRRAARDREARRRNAAFVAWVERREAGRGEYELEVDDEREGVRREG